MCVSHVRYINVMHTITMNLLKRMTVGKMKFTSVRISGIRLIQFAPAALFISSHAHSDVGGAGTCSANVRESP